MPSFFTADFPIPAGRRASLSAAPCSNSVRIMLRATGNHSVAKYCDSMFRPVSIGVMQPS
jgi:hypothetical protein